MGTNKGKTRRVPIPDSRTSENELDTDDLRSVIISPIDQNAELGRKLEEQNSVIKLSEDTIIELNKRAECIAKIGRAHV
jgi:hypothetical protein